MATKNQTREPGEIARRRSPYHHGDLRDAVMNGALEAIAREGVEAISLREIARDIGVSHGAPAHHFGDRLGLFTALAVAGLKRLRQDLIRAVASAGTDPMERLAAAGRAYVIFAAENPAYFEVMFHPKLLRTDDAELLACRTAATDVLREALAAAHDAKAGQEDSSSRDQQLGVAALRAWSAAHGLATLWLSGNIPDAAAEGGIEVLAARVLTSQVGRNPLGSD